MLKGGPLVAAGWLDFPRP